ncbi:MAG: hypothetical protein DMG97_27800 [Acidobacteria bacterium]|nr:MAG: hypothetical protein DMG97_27800 [Acidobacteriota bacterium]
MICVAKIRPVRMDRTRYAEVQHTVLQRDGWRCQLCGVRSHLEVHHQQFRSQAGSDVEENLITLCRRCHAVQHGT